jgi:uncharacterized protein (TIGR02246 family)
MKGFMAIFLAVMFCLTATAAVAEEPLSGAEAEVVDAMQTYSKAVRGKDIDTVMAIFAPADDAVALGTGPGERWIGEEAIRMAHLQFFETFEKESGETTWRHIRVEGDMAWGSSMSHSVNYYANVKNEFSLNNSFVLKKYEGEWRIVLLHFSNLSCPE